ncbi:RDD family protein [Actinoplanes solisilvae]|uniref:RDD family protein n=1 Tax=Actinoplanes solisilvae TaxID=2486853 RepID=UPI0013E3B010|nr:RDD family protein [Actinoplanes solisilvae]
MNLLPAPVTPGDAPVADGLVSAEAVEIELRPARLPSRALALFLDCLIMIAPAVLMAAIARAVFALFDEALGSAAMTVGVALVFVGYPVLSETLLKGASVGKYALGLRVIREDGGPLRARHALTRALVGFAVEFPGLLLLFLCWPAGILTMLASRQGRRLGDLAAGTIVVHEREAVPWRASPLMPPDLAGWASTLDLTAVDDALALEIRQFVTRVRELREPYRAGLLHQLADEVTPRLTPPPPPGLAPWLVLVAVLAERRRRQEAQLVTARAVTYRVLPTFGLRL